MKIFIEHLGSKRHPWLCLLAETHDEKAELEKLYRGAYDDDDGSFENAIEWQQNNFKLMFMLQRN